MVLPKLTGNLPTCHISALTRQAFPDLTLADKRFFVNEPVDVILGGDVYPQIMLDGIRKNVLGSLLAQETVFGWIVTGRANTIKPTNTCVSYYNEISLEKQLASFWELEEISKEKKLSEEERYCEELYKETTKRNEDGKYVVSLPFRKDYPVNISLGSSLKIAYSQFYRNEARLSRDENLQKEYNRVLNEYVELGHMAKIHTNQTADSSNNYYLPHHAVKKEESTSTKVRVVFNASQATSNGTSLNDILLPGPVLQADLTILILRWRLFKYVFNSDIEKMYRQILLKADQTKYQRIVFRNHPTEQTNIFELKTVTFGINCAPYLAIRTLLQLANNDESSLPVASNILRKCMYVDDVLAGGHSIEAAIKARNEIRDSIGVGRFPIKKMDSQLWKNFTRPSKRPLAKQRVFRLRRHNPESYTKRAILSDIAKLFDPLGWLAPIIVTAKMIMQHIWLEGTQWDEVVSPTTLDRWHTFMDNHRYIKNIKIPRWVHFSPTDDVSIHGFCDASEKAYAATVYLRVRTSNEVFVSLLLAKTRVAPVKTISLPRLELCGAVLLAETVESVVNNLELTHLKLKLWTDSTIVLAWIRKPPCSWSTFVSHRVTKIIEKVGNANWNHVDSGSNPADLASRGLMAQDLVENTLWCQGPSWLQEDQSKWPLRQNDYETTIEEKQVRVHACTTIQGDSNDILDRFSSLPRALRVLSYVMRFSQRTHPNTKASFQQKSCLISSEEIKATTRRLIINTKKQKYGQEYGCLKSGKPIDAKSEIISLNPFLDKDEVMRTRGRLGASLDLQYNERHPIILPYNCVLSRLIIQFIHQVSLHGENQLMLRLTRAQYWIPRVKNLIRSIIHNCKTCTIFKKRAQTQLMGALPSERSTFSRAFTNTGVDFASPFEIKSYRGRGCRVSKGYACLFVCFTTRAIHLEATTDLSTQSFLAALSRFVSRRGCPKNIYSDNGTNFVGASRSLRSELKAFIADARNNAISKYSHQALTWHFIPAAAPHMGGLWEAGHFLVGGHLMAPPEPDINESSASIVNRWQKLKALHQSFCKRWKTEYLNEMQKRIKWKHPKTNLKTGADTRVRVVDIVTEKGQVTRPLAKLVLLPPYEEENVDAHPTQHNSSLATSEA
ncbi:uncharacterized protein LOC128201320 [Galleria mellonella]|uniref:Uncharacterized protein LOC128201320 n=1 Tax=Galleria mellonella TaxID=7137 RepID=A0ABM3MRE8_GALME|nr:uncharacterized protein LOC128201320 [Galleria mellonella]